jgi:hypothetical protein
MSVLLLFHTVPIILNLQHRDLDLNEGPGVTAETLTEAKMYIAHRPAPTFLHCPFVVDPTQR